MEKYLSAMKSAYVFSLFFFSSTLIFILLHTIKPNFSAFPLFSLLKFNIDRNHMFLLCNGILVILVKSSSSSKSSAQKEKMGKSVKMSIAVAAHENVSEQQQQQQPSNNPSEVMVWGMSHVSEVVVVSEFVQDHADHNASEFVDDDEKDHGHDNYDDEEENDLDAEELNKRCEEFIRRMKQGIISESRVDHGLPAGFS